MLTWKDFDDRIFATFENYKAPNFQLSAFERQGLSNNLPLEAEVTLAISSTEAELKNKKANDTAVENTLGQDCKLKQFEEEKGEKLAGVRFPHYVKMCPYPHDDLGKLPIIRAVFLIQWLYRVFISHKAIDYSKDSMKTDMGMFYNFEEPSSISSNLIELVKTLEKTMEENMDESKLSGKADFIGIFKDLLRDHILKVQQHIVQELLQNEKGSNNDINSSQFYTNMKFQKAVLALGTEIVAYIHNYSEMTLGKICKAYEISCMDIWKLISPFLQAFTSLPYPLKVHLQELELSIVKIKAISDDSEFALHVSESQLMDSKTLQVFYMY